MVRALGREDITPQDRGLVVPVRFLWSRVEAETASRAGGEGIFIQALGACVDCLGS